MTGKTIDDRSAFLGKVQVLWTPASNWEARAIVSGERDRDGDYALNDLGALRRNPFHAARDFEGKTDRDVTSTTLLARRVGARAVFSTTTGVVKWRTHDLTDLDYTPLPLVKRDNREDALQFTQEVRLAAATPLRLSDTASLKWQAGVFLFTQGYDQDAVNIFSPFVFDQTLPFVVSQHSPKSALDDSGVGVYGQGTMTFRGNLDVTLGARLDHERKSATLDTFFEPQFPFDAVDAKEVSRTSRRRCLPRTGSRPRGWPTRRWARIQSGRLQCASPSGSEAYGETRLARRGRHEDILGRCKVIADAAVFHIDWNDLQLNLPNPAVPTVLHRERRRRGNAGVEFELAARPHANRSVRRPRLHARSLWRRQCVERPRRVTEQAADDA